MPPDRDPDPTIVRYQGISCPCPCRADPGAGLKIVLTSPYLWPEVTRGAERYLHELSAALVRRGQDVTVVGAGPAASRSEVLGVAVRQLQRRELPFTHRLQHFAPDVTFALQAGALMATRAVRADVWHAMSLPEGGVASWLGRRLPGLPRVVYSDHGLPHAGLGTRWPDRPFFRETVRSADAYVVYTDAGAALLASHAGRTPVVVPGGVRLGRFRPGRRSSSPLVLYSGALDVERKNVGALCDAVEIVRRRSPTVRLLLVGGGTPPRVPDWVEVRGPVGDEELAEAYASAWLTALPSHLEAFGLVLLEALASGTPGLAIAGEAGPASVLTPETGVLAASASAADLATAIERGLELASHPATADACRARAASFDWDEVIAPMFIDLYESVLSR